MFSARLDRLDRLDRLWHSRRKSNCRVVRVEHEVLTLWYMINLLVIIFRPYVIVVILEEVNDSTQKSHMIFDILTLL